MYLTTDLYKYLTKLKIEQPAGQKFNCISLNTQLLAKIIESATNMPVQEYLQSRLWEREWNMMPLGVLTVKKIRW